MKEKKNRRFISIQIKRGERDAIFILTTRAANPRLFREGLPVTTKRDKAYHGFGVRSVKYIVDKYKGNLLMQAADGRFSVGHPILPVSRKYHFYLVGYQKHHIELSYVFLCYFL